jgi:CelD/BcsL family acetyltransferase involved in cellulose biosynthesis
MYIKHVNPRSDLQWQTLVERQPTSVFHSPAWIRTLIETYGFDVDAYLVIDEAGQPVGGLPFCRIVDPLGERIVALPFSDYCDPLVNSQEEWRILIDRLVSEQRPVAIRCLHADAPLCDGRFSLSKRAKWHGIDLAPDLDALWLRLHKSSRWSVHRARQDGVVVRPAQTKEELHAFFELHLKLRKYKHHLLAQPFSFFENIWRLFIEPGHGTLLLAYYRDTPISGVLFLEWQDTLYYKFNTSDPAYLAHQPNDLVTWTGIEYGKVKGCKRFDFGLSDWEHEGLIHYKRKFATEERTISYLRYTPASAPSQQERQVRDLLSRMTDLFVDQSVPDSVTDRAGQELYRYFA